MPRDYENHLQLTESSRILVGSLTKAAISWAFDETRASLNARTLRRIIRRRHISSNGLTTHWSLWIGRFYRPPSWLTSNQLQDIRHAMALVLEQPRMVAVTSSLAGDFVSRLGLPRPTYKSMVTLNSTPDSQYVSINIRALRGTGVTRSSLAGKNLEQTLPRGGSHRSVATGMRFETDGKEWVISPPTGRVGRTGSKVTIDQLCEFFGGLITALQNPPSAPAPFIQSFATPQDFTPVGVSLHPTALLFDSGIIEEHLTQGWRFEINGTPLPDADLRELALKLSAIWDLQPVEDLSNPGAPPKKWEIRRQADSSGAIDAIGELARRTTKLSINSAYLNNIIAVDPDNLHTPLKSWFNKGDVPFMVSFQDPAYIYYDGQLFHDHRILSSSEALTEVFTASLPTNTTGEKRTDGNSFHSLSLFGLTEQLSANADFILCDDYGTEWADYITIQTGQITFYHCKSTSTAVGASGLHEVVSQAIKNIGLLSAEREELDLRKTRWEGNWTTTAIPRLRRGSSVTDFIESFLKASAAPNYRPKVVLVVSGLSKNRVVQSFEDLRSGNHSGFHVPQLLWILSFFVDACRSAGAEASVVCEP